MGFAIPANQAKPIVDDLINYGRVTGRVLLGITAQEVDEVLARLNHWPTGLLVISTQEGTDISRKGVVPGDVITKINDKEIKGLQDLSDEIEGKKPGDTVDLEVYRPSNRPNGDGRFFEVTIALVEDTSGQEQPQQPQDSQGYGQNPYGQNPGYGQDPGYGDGYDPFDEFFRDFFG